MFAILSTSIGQLLLKKYNTNSKNYFILFFALGLLVSIPIWIYFSLKYLSFIVVFISDSLSIVLIVILSNIFLKEKLDLSKFFGILFIIIGIFMLKGRILWVQQ
jgi:uncharacterized membrane protein